MKHILKITFIAATLFAAPASAESMTEYKDRLLATGLCAVSKEELKTTMADEYAETDDQQAAIAEELATDALESNPVECQTKMKDMIKKAIGVGGTRGKRPSIADFGY